MLIKTKEFLHCNENPEEKFSGMKTTKESSKCVPNQEKRSSSLGNGNDYCYMYIDIVVKIQIFKMSVIIYMKKSLVLE